MKFVRFVVLSFSEKDLVIALLPIVVDSNRAPHLVDFLKFLESADCKDTRITLDQWDSFLQFCHTVNQDLSNYEDDGACKFYVNLFKNKSTSIQH